MCWASAPACSPAIVATTWRGRSVESSAHSATAPCERSQPSRAARRRISSGSRSSRARSSSRNEPRRFCSTSSRASSTATSVRQATAARCRNSSASADGSASPSSSTAPSCSSPEAIGTSAATPGGTAAARPRGGPAAWRRRAPASATVPDAAAAPRRGTTMATTPPVSPAARAATPSRPSPPSTASTIRRCTERSRSTTVAPRGCASIATSNIASLKRGAAVTAAPRIRLVRTGLSPGRLHGDLRVGLQGVLAGLARANPVGLLDRHDEHLAVADRARAGVLEDGVDHRLHVLAGHDAFELDLRPQPVRQLGAAIALRDALLTPGAFDLRDRQGRKAHAQQLHPDGLERLVPDVRLDLLHAGTSRVVAAAARPGTAGAPAGAYPTSSGAGMNCSGYPYMPCSEMSSPASSSSAETRRPYVFLMAQKVRKEKTKTNVNAATTPMIWANSWWKEPLYTRPGSPPAL